MFTWYKLFTFVHVTGAIVWIGGVTMLSILSARLTRAGAGAAAELLSRQNDFIGRAVLGPAAITTLLAGLVLMRLARVGFPLWMGWGVVGVLGSILLGIVVLRRAGLELSVLASAERPDARRMAVLRRRLAFGGLLNIALLLSTVWAMVFKPVL